MKKLVIFVQVVFIIAVIVAVALTFYKPSVSNTKQSVKQNTSQNQDASASQDINTQIANIFESMMIQPIRSDAELIIENMEVTTLDGKPKMLYDEIDESKSKIIVLNIYATWCPYCKKEMNALNNLHNKVSGLSVIALDSGEDYQKVSTFMKANFKLDYPIIVDKNNKMMISYGLTGLPSTLILDKDKRIIGLKIGYFDWNLTIDGFSQIVNLIK